MLACFANEYNRELSSVGVLLSILLRIDVDMIGSHPFSIFATFVGWKPEMSRVNVDECEIHSMHHQLGIIGGVLV